jgi:hypothetical protein
VACHQRLYWTVFTGYQASNPFIHGAHFNGRAIYELVTCASREAATAEAVYAAGVNGWNVAFSCVTRLSEAFNKSIITRMKCGDS